MKITWDAKTNSVYVTVSNNPIGSTVTGTNDPCMLAYDVDQKLVGIEVLNVDSKPEIVEI